MRHIIYLSIIILFGCNSNKNHHDPKFDGFHYSWDSLINPKVFVYSRIDNTNERALYYQQLLILGKDSFFIQTNLNDGPTRDSNKYLISGPRTKLVEAYMLKKSPKGLDYKIAEGEIEEYVKEDLTRKAKIKYVNPFDKSNVLTIESNGKVDSLMTMNHKNIPYSCLAYSAITKVSSGFKYFRLSKNSVEKFSKSIYAKNLGLIQWSMEIQGRKSVWRLDTILNYKDYKNNMLPIDYYHLIQPIQ